MSQRNRLDAAKDAYVALIKLDGSKWDAYYELGKLYASTGDSANAKKTLGDLVAKKPDYDKRAEVDQILAGL